MNKVILLVGPSGCGKSTWTQDYTSREDGPFKVCSADHFFHQPDGSYVFDGGKLSQAHRSCMYNFVEALKAEVPLVIVDNTNTRERERKDYVYEAKQHGYEVWLKVFQVDPKVCAERNVHGVPLEAVEKMAARVDVPEGFYALE